jgi:hypothetical protein
VAFCDATNRQAVRRIASLLHVPVIAVVPGRRGTPLLQSRADCDRLQQSLAPDEHCAGFVVYSDVEDAGDPKTSSEQGEPGGK